MKDERIYRRHALPREICVADVFDVSGRGPESVDKGGQLLLHVRDGVDVGCDVEGRKVMEWWLGRETEGTLRRGISAGLHFEGLRCLSTTSCLNSVHPAQHLLG